MKVFQIIVSWFTCWFVLLFIISLPFEYHFLPDIGNIASPFFENVSAWFARNVLGFEGSQSFGFASDSLSLYVNALVCMSISIPMAIVSFLLDKGQKFYSYMWYGTHLGISYYLALQLFKYGFDKLFKHQFYLPEPNILFTPMGELTRDILYWSSIGSSYPYSVFAGVIEIIPAVLLLFRRTRILGALIAIPVMINVLMINIGFDISVKLYSTFLLFLGIVIISPNLKKLYDFFILNRETKLKSWELDLPVKKKFWTHALPKAILIGIILSESLFIYVKTQNFNDDTAARPLFHGAYEVVTHQINDEIISPILHDQKRLKRIFIHRQGYLITQSMTDEMRDFKLTYQVADKKLITEDYSRSIQEFDYHYERSDSTLTLTSIIFSDTLTIKAKQIDLSKLPLLQNKIHWTLEDYL